MSVSKRPHGLSKSKRAVFHIEDGFEVQLYKEHKPGAYIRRQMSAGVIRVPDIAVIVCDGAVGGEVSSLGDIHEGLPRPSGFIPEVGEHPGLGGAVIREVREGHEPVLIL